jgi:purine-cytosine permease-like protein
MNILMTDADDVVASKPVAPSQQEKSKNRWKLTAGAWLGIGTSPGALLLGVGIAARYGGAVPLFSLLLSILVMALILWFQGLIGLPPPIGEGKNLTQLAPLYLGSTMQRILGAVIGIGMIGWFGFNVGLGAAALSALVNLPQWVTTLILGVPVLVFALMGIQSWNWLAAVTTVSVLVLVALVTFELSARSSPLTLRVGSPANLVADVAIFLGYVSVFSLRTPDFTSRLKTRKDLFISILLLIVPLVAIALAGVGMQQGTGSTDLVETLAGPEGLAIGNLLITLSVIAPTFTTFFSGAPGLKAAVGIDEKIAMFVIGLTGMALSAARFDLLLLPWLSILGSVLPPFVVPLAVEATMRRRNHPPRLIPWWVWLPGSVTAVILTVGGQSLAPMIGMLIAALLTALWQWQER